MDKFSTTEKFIFGDIWPLDVRNLNSNQIKKYELWEIEQMYRYYSDIYWWFIKRKQ